MKSMLIILSFLLTPTMALASEITLHDYYTNEPVVIDSVEILSIAPDKQGTLLVTSDNDGTYWVREDYHNVISLIKSDEILDLTK